MQVQQVPVRRRRRRRELTLAFVASLVPILVFVWVVTAYQKNRASMCGFATENRGDPQRVTYVTPDTPAEAAGLQVGDVIVALNGKDLTDALDSEWVVEPHQQVTLRVQRGTQTVELNMRAGIPVSLSEIAVQCLLLLAYLGAGILALVLRPGFAWAKLCFCFCWLVALEMSVILRTGIGWQIVAAYLLNGAQLAVELHLVGNLPEPQRWLQPRWVVPFLYALGSVVALLLAAVQLQTALGFGPNIPKWVGDPIRDFVYFGWAIAIPALLALAAFRSPDQRGRRLARLILAGVLPWSLFVIAMDVFYWFAAGLPPIFETLQSAVLLCYPAAIFAAVYIESTARGTIVSGLMRRIEDLDSYKEISSALADALTDAFHPLLIGTYHRAASSDALELDYCTQGEWQSPRRLPVGKDLLRAIGSYDRVFDFPEDFRLALDEAGSCMLDELGVRLVAPLRGKADRAAGLLLLGRNRSGEPYCEQDVRLVDELAGSLGLVYENLALRGDRDRSRRRQAEVLARLDEREFNLVKECPNCGRCFDAESEACSIDGAELEARMPVERVIGRRYRLDRLIGRGGMGAVYAAADLRLRRLVAVKILLPSLFGDVTALLRFEREGQIAARLDHPGIVTVHDFGVTEAGGAFLVMEELDGETLASVLRAVGRLRPAIAATWFDQICTALEHAHGAGVVHRDLKPGNIFVAREADQGTRIVLLDFGLARVHEQTMRTSIGLTTPGTVLGTFAYMAPEQLAGEVADERSDIFSLGLIIVEALTGRNPLAQMKVQQILEHFDPSWFRLPAENESDGAVQRILSCCLLRDPRERYQCVRDLREELIPALGGLKDDPPARGKSLTRDSTAMDGGLDSTIDVPGRPDP